MVIQFHLTNKCNFRCKHCYQDEYGPHIISLDDYKTIIDKTKAYFENKNPFVSIFLTGGEPLIIPNFLEYVKYADQNQIHTGILSNGTLITSEILKQLKNTEGFMRIQVSLEGPQEINDKIRGDGSYKKIYDAIKMIKTVGLICSVSCTIAPYNYNKIEDLYDDLIKDAKPDWLWFDRCIPFKEAGTLTTTQFKEFLSIVDKMQKKWRSQNLPTKVSAVRALQFLANEKENPYYRCGAGVNHFTIMSNGDVMICRRLNFAVGNLLKEEWQDIINRIFPQLVEMHKTPDDCSLCQYADVCNGGLKCLTWNQFKNFNHKDINCPL